MSKKIKIALFLFCSINVSAQEKLSLSDAIKIGLDKNFKISIAQDQAAIAKNNNNWGEAGRYPTIDITINQNNNILDASNNPTSFIQDKIFTNSVAGNAVLNWVLFSGFRVNLTKDRLEMLQAQSEGNAVVVIENTVQSIILAYYNAVLQKEKLEVLRDLVRLSKDKYAYFLEKKEFGLITTFDILNIKNAFLADSTNLLLQQLAYKNSMRNLNLLLTQDVEKEIELTDFLIAPKESYDLNTLKEKMLKNNNNIQNQYINLELQRTAIELARSSLYPVVSFQMGANNSYSHFKTSLFSSDGSNLNYYGNFIINFNLFNGGKTKRAIENARIQEKITQTTTDELVFTLTSQLVNTNELYNARLAILALSTESYKSSEYSLQLAKERLQQGTINSFAFRDVQLTFLNSAMTRLDAAYQLINAHTELLRLTGGILDVKSE